MNSDIVKVNEATQHSVFETFQKNNVRKDMAYLSPYAWGKSLYDGFANNQTAKDAAIGSTS